MREKLGSVPPSVADQMSDSDIVLYGEDAGSWLAPLRMLVPSLTGYRYTFMPPAEFQVLSMRDMGAGMEVYWRELLYRSHFAAATSLLRMERWLSGAIQAYEAANLFSFAACVRGAIESAADSFDALDVVAPTLADSHMLFKQALKGKMSEMRLHPDLERRLIHFSHGRRLEKGESAPDTHKAKTTTAYIKRFASEYQNEIETCYANLCQITHPSWLSLAPFLETNEDGSVVRISVTAMDREPIESLAVTNLKAMLPVFVMGIMPAILTLRVLNKLPLVAMHTGAAEKIGLSDNEAWTDLSQRLKDPSLPVAKETSEITEEEAKEWGLGLH
jgi:hypothetical protein